MNIAKLTVVSMTLLLAAGCLTPIAEAGSEKRPGTPLSARQSAEELEKIAANGAIILGAADQCGIDRERLDEDFNALLAFIDENVRDNAQKSRLADIMTKGLDIGAEDVRRKGTDCRIVKKSLQEIEPYLNR